MSHPTTSTTAAAKRSVPPAALASTPPAPPGLRHAGSYERITREPPLVAGYFTRELVHFLGRTSDSQWHKSRAGAQPIQCAGIGKVVAIQPEWLGVWP